MDVNRFTMASSVSGSDYGTLGVLIRCFMIVGCV